MFFYIIINLITHNEQIPRRSDNYLTNDLLIEWNKFLIMDLVIKLQCHPASKNILNYEYLQRVL